MARPREFDEVTALEAAIECFWPAEFEVKLRRARDTRTPEAARRYLDMWTLHDFSSECDARASAT
jgi:hypothetical protein